MLSQNVAATVPLVQIMLSGTANNQNCENKCVISQIVTVQRGTAVEWINNDLVPHTLVSGKPEDKNNGTLFDSGQIWVGKSVIHDFNYVGVYHYFEKDHPQNTGIINVTDNSVKGYGFCCAHSSSEPYVSPLKQFKSGIAAKGITCKSDFQLVIKFEDGSPACVKPETAQKLLSRGWVRNPSIQEILKGPENENTTLQIAGTIFYYLTLNDTMTGSKGNGIQTTFHNVLFTFLPSPWHPAPLGGCAGFIFGSSAKFTDGTLELLRVDVPETGCLKNYIQSDMTNHTTPQAGLIVFSDGKIRLLVSVNNLVHPVPGQHPKDADAWLATHPHFVGCLVWNLKTQLAKEVPCTGH